MPFDKPLLNTSNPYRRDGVNMDVTKSIFYGKVMSIDDETDGGRIKVKIPNLDNQKSDDNLPWSYPLLPKFFHIYPQVGEMVRVFVEDIKYPDKNRYWLGSVISQLQNIGYESSYTALSTTDIGITIPQPAITKYPDAVGVFPNKEDVGIIGKINTDIILKANEVHLRAGKHENDNILKLNTKNPSEISLIYEKATTTGVYQSNAVIMSDKIALISHSGNPQFKAARLETKDREKIFEEGHPIPRGDVLVEALEIIRRTLINHIHGYSNLPADKTAVILELEKINFDNILQKNIVIN